MAAETDEAVIVYTDGACSGNPGMGGWAAILTWRGVERELAGGEAYTTNNRMELMAAIAALESLKRPMRVELHTDSVYLKDGISKWIHGWRKNGWKTAAKAPVKNEDLWRRLDDAQRPHEIVWRWVKGHADDVLNERCDALARGEIKKLRQAGTVAAR